MGKPNYSAASAVSGEYDISKRNRYTNSVDTIFNKQKGLKRLFPFIGPAFIAAVAYIDPGNFATNIQSGSQYGYLLLWVILASNLMAILIQTLFTHLGSMSTESLKVNLKSVLNAK